MTLEPNAAERRKAAREHGEPESKTPTYDPRDVRLTFNGVEIAGFMDDSFIEQETDGELVQLGLRSKGSVQFTTVIGTSGSMDFLTEVANLEKRYWPVAVEVPSKGVRHQLEVDTHGVKTVHAPQGIIWYFGRRILRLDRKTRRKRRLALWKKRGRR